MSFRVAMLGVVIGSAPLGYKGRTHPGWFPRESRKAGQLMGLTIINLLLVLK